MKNAMVLLISGMVYAYGIATSCAQTIENALQTLESGKQQQAATMMEKLHHEKNWQGSLYLAHFYAIGIGVKKDIQKSTELYEKVLNSLADLTPPERPIESLMLTKLKLPTYKASAPSVTRLFTLEALVLDSKHKSALKKILDSGLISVNDLPP